MLIHVVLAIDMEFERQFVIQRKSKRRKSRQKLNSKNAVTSSRLDFFSFTLRLRASAFDPPGAMNELIDTDRMNGSKRIELIHELIKLNPIDSMSTSIS